jgi:long-chain acyl-CoA synthetase
LPVGLRPGRAAAWLARQVEVGAAEVELSLAQYRLLVLLETEAAAPSLLADRLAVSRPSVTAVVDGLVSRGLVQRTHDEDDRRRVTHTLTPQGRRVLAAADEAVEQRLALILDHLDDQETRAAALDGLDCWREAMLRLRAARAEVDQKAKV